MGRTKSSDIPNNSAKTEVRDPDSQRERSMSSSNIEPSREDLPARSLSPFSLAHQLPTQPSITLPHAALSLASTLFTAARTGSLPPLQTALSHGLPPNLRNTAGDTLLMLASYHDHAPLVSLLLSNGADANVLNDRGQSPIAGAVFKGYEDVVKVLLEEGGADVWRGVPCAVDCARMFRREGILTLFGVEVGLSERPWEDGVEAKVGAVARRPDEGVGVGKTTK